VNTLQDLVEHAKRNPGKLSYSSSGVGSWVHLAAEVFKQATGTDIVHVPYKGTGPMTADLAAGRVEVSFPSLATAANFLAAGKVKVLALAEVKRYPGKPDIPTIGETYAGFQKPPSWIAAFGPAGMPQPVVRRINAATVKALDSAEVRAHYARLNALIIGGTPEELAATVKRDWEITAKLVKTLGIQPE
jgi:tripartite-type tricarboxylate transporter receptor subunit TctC